MNSFIYNFFVLGIIPGTDTQITFQTWAKGFPLLLVLYTLYRFYQRRGLVIDALPGRQPLPASLLHQRG
jgi:hypothetical protein